MRYRTDRRNQSFELLLIDVKIDYLKIEIVMPREWLTLVGSDLLQN